MPNKYVLDHPVQQATLKVATQITSRLEEGTQQKTASTVGLALETNNNKLTKVQTQLKPEGGALPEPQPEAPVFINQMSVLRSRK